MVKNFILFLNKVENHIIIIICVMKRKKKQKERFLIWIIDRNRNRNYKLNPENYIEKIYVWNVN